VEVALRAAAKETTSVGPVGPVDLVLQKGFESQVERPDKTGMTADRNMKADRCSKRNYPL
jgi:hypothetical protein